MSLLEEHVSFLAEAADSKAFVYLSGSGCDVSFQTTILKVEEDRVVLMNSVPPEMVSQLWKSEKFMLQVNMARFAADRIESDGVNIVFHIKSLKLIEETRASERFSFTAEERVVCEFLNPFDQETWISKSVMDMSSTGLSVSASMVSCLFKEGVHFDTMKIVIDGEPYTVTSGTVVYVRKVMETKGKMRAQVGFKFD